MKLQPFIVAGIFGRGMRFGLEAVLIYFYGDVALDAVTWLLDHELIMGIGLLGLIAGVLWWFNSKNVPESNSA
jgi:membrane protein DedA with SNARE-associated domain